MRFKGLKLSIAVDFSLLLSIGMLLVNFILISLWQQYAVKKSIEKAKILSNIIVHSSGEACENLPSIILSSDRILKTSEIDIVLYSNNKILSNSLQPNIKLEQTLTLAAKSQKEIIKTYGNIFSIFGLSPQDIFIVQPAKNCRSRSSIGVFIHMKSAHKEIMEKQSYVLVYILVNVIVLSTLGFFRMRKLIVKPLEKLVTLSETFRGDNSDLLSLSRSKSEFGHIASSLHSMLSRIKKDKAKLNTTIQSLENANKQILENQKSLVDTEKFAAIGRLSAGFAHEIGNPLGIIKGYTELLRRENITLSERKEYAERATKELDRVARLIQQLLDLARKKKNTVSQTVIYPVIQCLIEMLRHQKSAENINFEIVCDNHGQKVSCNETDLHQVLLNCMLNSIDAITESNKKNGKLIVSTSLTQKLDKDYVKIEIKDNGSGVAANIIPSVFEPFFTTKQVGQGTGLGLSVSRSIIENNGGTMQIESENMTGSVVTILLPGESK